MTHETIPPPHREPAAAPEPTAAAPRKTRKPRRTNADYRWTVPKVTAFLAALAKSGRVADAARAVGMSRQAAYKLRARLDGPKFRAAFEGARKAGVRARAEASRERLRSRWDGPGLAALDHLRQGGGSAAQGDRWPLQGDALSARSDAPARQGDAFARKATKDPLDSVTSGPCPPRNAGRED